MPNDPANRGKRASRADQPPADSNTYRFFVDPAAIEGDAVMLRDRALVHQLVVVLRLQPGQRITLLDNSGTAYDVRVDSLGRHEVAGEVVTRTVATGEPRLKLTLYQAVLRGERFEWVLQKGTEVGVSTFVPVICARSQTTATATKLERWQRIVREAAEQARRACIPQLLAPVPFAAALAHAARSGILLWEGAGGQRLHDLLVVPPVEQQLWSGPEGGWSPDEREAAEAAGLSLVTLGARTLRAETAPLVAAAAILYASGDLE